MWVYCSGPSSSSSCSWISSWRRSWCVCGKVWNLLAVKNIPFFSWYGYNSNYLESWLWDEGVYNFKALHNIFSVSILTNYLSKKSFSLTSSTQVFTNAHLCVLYGNSFGKDTLPLKSSNSLLFLSKLHVTFIWFCDVYIAFLRQLGFLNTKCISSR